MDKMMRNYYRLFLIYVLSHLMPFQLLAWKIWRRIVYVLLFGLIAISVQAQSNASRMDWWREARFGMFIHLGLYSAAAGEWNEKEVEGIGEWIQNFAKVPNSEYEKLLSDFTLSKCKPETWVQIAKQAGV